MRSGLPAAAVILIVLILVAGCSTTPVTEKTRAGPVPQHPAPSTPSPSSPPGPQTPPVPHVPGGLGIAPGFP